MLTPYKGSMLTLCTSSSTFGRRVGPYFVVKHEPTTFVILRDGEQYAVLINRLKATYLMEYVLQQSAP